ncbi:unnamed protein product [Rhizoctonia solani]|uniref:Uncharacterized protein n=1 Tax=Rhizoctonia solani TaxID=456999 RepID=A0A8H3DYM7_9AGAM|nr:unnamed protein product [Rhizoctonia solani]
MLTVTAEVYTEPDIAQQALPELPSPPRITGLSPAPLDLLLPYEYIPDQWPIPHSPELSSLFTSTYGNDLFDYPGLSSEITGPSGIMNQGYLYNQHGATYQGMYFPHNRPREHGPFSNSRSRQSSAGHTPPFLPSSPESPQPRYDLGTSTGSLLFVPDSEAGSNAELAKTSYTAYIGLLTFKWSNSRQGLPPELALYICQLAGYKVWHAKAAPAGPKGVYEWDSQIQSLVWFQTEPFTRRMLGRTKSVQLVTKYDTRSPLTGIGDTNVGWFELQIARPIEQDVVTHAKVGYRPNGDKMSWFSHRNRGVVGPREFLREYQGAVFDSDHEIWDQIEEGDVLQVVVKAPLHVRAYTASSGFLRISTWWKPSSEMLALMDVRNAQSK